MKTLRRTGKSSNITYYAEQSSGDRQPFVWTSVLRSDFSWPGGVMTLRRIPAFHFTVYVNAKGEVGQFTYEPKTRPAAGPLSSTTVTRLVRERIEKRKPWDSQPNRPAVPARAGRS